MMATESSEHNSGSNRAIPARNLSEWSAFVKARDGKCMRCGVLDDLHAHHIKPKSTHADLKLSLENGVTLCYRCHKAEHERNRPVRIRSNRPQRKTMERRIAELEQMVAELDAENRALKNQAGKCKRGFCESGFEVSRLKCLLRDMQSGKCAA